MTILYCVFSKFMKKDRGQWHSMKRFSLAGALGGQQMSFVIITVAIWILFITCPLKYHSFCCSRIWQLIFSSQHKATRQGTDAPLDEAS
ncbi:MAG: hypothetical protein LBL26_04060, partial [Peptococcaceae bacterium]|nr:hypothetical protein [Peptococcaceae bacterium]